MRKGLDMKMGNENLIENKKRKMTKKPVDRFINMGIQSKEKLKAKLKIGVFKKGQGIYRLL